MRKYLQSEVTESYKDRDGIIYSKNKVFFGLFTSKGSPINGTVIDNNGLYTDYVNGKKNGLQKSFYENKQLQMSTEYKNGLKHGMDSRYHPNGNLKIQRIYENGNQIGETKSWDENGHRTVPKIGW